MSIIKQLATYDGSTWTTDDIGANASNVSLTTNVAGQTNVQSALSKIVGTSALTADRAVITGTGGVLSTSTVTNTELSYLSGATSNIQTQINTLNNNLQNIDNHLMGWTSYPLDQDIRSISVKYKGFTHISTTDASTLIGSPVNSGSFVAFRHQQDYRNPNDTNYVHHATVTLYEVYPQRGRVWINSYNKDMNPTWSGWSTISNNFQNLITVKNYSYTYSLAGNTRMNITKDNLNLVNPLDDMYVIGIGSIYSGNVNVVIGCANPISSNVVITLANLASGTINSTCNIRAIYVKDDYINWIN